MNTIYIFSTILIIIIVLVGFMLFMYKNKKFLCRNCSKCKNNDLRTFASSVPQQNTRNYIENNSPKFGNNTSSAYIPPVQLYQT